jgi:hypothetical protein
VGNEENEYPVPDPNRTMINMTNEFNVVHKECLKEEIMNKLIEILMEKLQDTVKQNKQNKLKEYQHIRNKKLEKTQKQLNNSERTSTNFKMNFKMKQRRL